MVVGSVVVGACLLVLGWTSEIVGIFMNESESVCVFSWVQLGCGYVMGWILSCGLCGANSWYRRKA